MESGDDVPDGGRTRRSSSRETIRSQSEKQEALSRVVSSFQTYLDEMEDSYEMTIDGAKFIEELIPRILLPIKLITPKFWKSHGKERNFRSWWSLGWRIVLWCASVTEMFASVVGRTSTKHNTDVVVESLEPLYLYIIHCVYTAMIKATVKADGVKQRRHREAAAAVNAFRHVQTPLVHEDDDLMHSDDDQEEDPTFESYFPNASLDTLNASSSSNTRSGRDYNNEDLKYDTDNPMHKRSVLLASDSSFVSADDDDIPSAATSSTKSRGAGGAFRQRRRKKHPRKSVLVKEEDRNAARKFFEESVRSDLDGPLSLMNSTSRTASVKILQKSDSSIVDTASVADSASPPSSMKITSSTTNGQQQGLSATVVLALSRFRSFRSQIATRTRRISSGASLITRDDIHDDDDGTAQANNAQSRTDNDLEAGRSQTTNKKTDAVEMVPTAAGKKRLVPMIPETSGNEDNEPPLAAKMRAVLSEREHSARTAMLQELVTSKIGSKESVGHLKHSHGPLSTSKNSSGQQGGDSNSSSSNEQQQLRASRTVVLNELIKSTMAKKKRRRHDDPAESSTHSLSEYSDPEDPKSDTSNKKNEHTRGTTTVTQLSISNPATDQQRQAATATSEHNPHQQAKIKNSNNNNSAMNTMLEDVKEAELVGRRSSNASVFSDGHQDNENDGSDAVLPRLTEWAQLLFEVNSGKKRYQTMRYCAMVLAALHVGVAPVCNLAHRGEQFQWLPGSTDSDIVARTLWCTVFLLGRLANFWFALLFFSDLHFCVLEYMFRFHVQRSVSALASRRDLECLCLGTFREPLLRLDLDISSIDNGPINLVLWYTLRRFVNILFSIRNRDTDIRVCVAAIFLFSWTAAVLFALLFSHDGPSVLGGSFVLLVAIVLFNTIVLVCYVIGIFRFGIRCNYQNTLDASRLLKLQYIIEQQRFFHTTDEAQDKRLVDYHSLVSTVTRLIESLDYPATLGGVRMTMSTAVGIISVLISTIFGVVLEVQS